jgi:beta-phosphoglucomutase-like phosphatase (HAD superfamily)
VVEVVRALSAQGLTLGVASSGGHEKLRLTLGLTGLAPFFTGQVFSASEVARGKPAPDLFLHACSRLRGVPERTVVIEDSLPGVLGARAAGMTVFAYVETGPTEAHRAAGATVFRTMQELPGLLQDWLAALPPVGGAHS